MPHIVGTTMPPPTFPDLPGLFPCAAGELAPMTMSLSLKEAAVADVTALAAPEEACAASRVGAAPGAPQDRQGNTRRLLLVDAPNLQARITEFLGHASRERPSYAALATWFSEQLQRDTEAEAIVFATAPEPLNDGFRTWVHRLRTRGYGVYVKPGRGRVDIDTDLVQLARERVERGLDELVVVTSDLYRDHQIEGVEPLVALSKTTRLTVVGFVEKVNGYAAKHPEIRFVDPAEVPGLLPAAVSSRRTVLNALPAEGALLEPIGPLTPVSEGAADLERAA